MKSTKVSTRYAQALLDLAIEQNKLEIVANDMRFLDSTSNENKDFILFLESPIVNSAKKIEVLKAIFEQFDVLSSAFVSLIAKNRREAYLPGIAAAFETLLKAHKGIVPITITSAIVLDESTKASIIAKVQSSVKGTLEVTEKTDASLIGGFIVSMGDTRIDASVASQLNQLKQRLTR